jgi:carboxyl-terminal processing protease
MRSKGMFAGVVLGCTLVSGGWLVKRGLAGTAAASPTDNARLFQQVLNHVARDFVDTLPDSALYVRAADGLLEELNDPHTAYLSPQLLARLSEQTSGRYAGVGASIDIRDGWVTVVSPLPGGPALDAGIQSGDRIVKVEGKPLHEVTIEEAQKALRGEPGSVVRLTIERPGVTAPMDFTLKRREIRVRSVQHASVLRDGIGFVGLSVFSAESATDLKRAIDSLRAAGMKSLILDLRNDPGGLLDQGVAVTDLFLNPNQTIVSMRGRTLEASRTFADRIPQFWADMPMIVMVDSLSASASEIVAGALQDHDRALVVGTPTYGKGSAQNVFPLTNGGAVKLTTALWYTPSGRSINRKRVDPDAPASGVGQSPSSDTTERPTYKTDAGRTVYGGGGIVPDVVLPPTGIVATDTMLGRALGKHIPQFRDALTEYALSLKVSRAITSRDFAVTPAMRAELYRRMQARHIPVDSATYGSATPSIDRLLGLEIARWVFGLEAEFSRRLRDDAGVAKAVSLLSGVATQQDLLQRATGRSARP